MAVIVVTGAANGIGKEVALVCSSAKATLVLIDCDSIGLNTTAKLCSERGSDTRTLCIDVTDKDKLDSSIQQVLKGMNGVEYVFLCAGISDTSNSSNTNMNVGQKIISVNFFGALNTYFSLLPFSHPRKMVVVFITSVSSLIATHNSGWYSASKSALARYLDSIRLNHAGSNIQIKEVVLGFVKTNFTLNVPHARYISISSSQAASQIVLFATSKKIIRSIPYFRNFPWIFLAKLPRSFQHLTLYRLGKLLKKS